MPKESGDLASTETNSITAEESYNTLLSLRGSLRQAIEDGDIDKAEKLKMEMTPYLETLRKNTNDFAEEAKSEFFDAAFQRNMDEAEEILLNSGLTAEGRKETIQEGLLFVAESSPLRLEEYIDKFGVKDEDYSTDEIQRSLKWAMQDLENDFHVFDYPSLKAEFSVAKKFGITNPEELIAYDLRKEMVEKTRKNKGKEAAAKIAGLLGIK